MPARMWRCRIYLFLELLRRKLPDSLEHTLIFIYLTYSMMALLYETLPSFAETWIECLGDWGRYRMAIEDDDMIPSHVKPHSQLGLQKVVRRRPRQTKDPR